MKDNINAHSKKDGIVFQSPAYPFIYVETIRDVYGEIHSWIIPKELVKATYYYDYEDIYCDQFYFFLLDIVLIVLSLLSRKLNLILATFWFTFAFSNDFSSFFLMSYHMKSRKGKAHSMARYHAAEHMVLNAHRALKKIPTLTEIKNYSRFSERCGSGIVVSKLVLNGFCCIILVLAEFLPIYITIMLALIVPTVIAFFTSKGYLKFFQVFITEKPSDAELEVAIAGLRQLQEVERLISLKNLKNK